MPHASAEDQPAATVGPVSGRRIVSACLLGMFVFLFAMEWGGGPLACRGQTLQRSPHGQRQDWDPSVYRTRRKGVPVGPRVEVWESANHVFSWLHWWELNRFLYLEETRQWLGGGLPPLSREGELQRDLAAEMLRGLLLSATQDPSDHDLRLQAEVVLALGRMMDPRWRQRLLAEPQRWLAHPSDRVRTNAWLSLGLLARPLEAQDAAWTLLLAAPQVQDEVSLAARAASLGLVSAPSKEAREALLRMLQQRLPDEAHRMALRSLRWHARPEDSDLFLAWLEQTPSPFIAQEAMYALGAHAGGSGLPVLLQELDGVGSVRRDREAVFRRLDTVGELQRRNTIPRLRSELRAAAALALGSYPTDRRLWRRIEPVAYRNAIYTTSDGRNEFFRGPAWLLYARTAFYRSGQEQEHLAALEEGLRGRRRMVGQKMALWSDHADRLNSSRGFAAIATGLFLRRMAPHTDLGKKQPYPAPDHQRDRLVRQSFQRLSHLVQSRQEPRELRAAAALALGLSAQLEAAEEIAGLFDSLHPEDGMVAGALVAALGLLGDPTTEERGIESMRRFGQAVTWVELWSRRPVDVMQWMEPVLGWRLALLGRAAVPQSRIPRSLWQEQLGAHPFVADDVARLERLGGSTLLTPLLLEVLSTTDPGDRRLVAVRALGERWAAEPAASPSAGPRLSGALDRLSRLTLEASFALSMRWEAGYSAGAEALRDRYPLPWTARASEPFLYEFMLMIGGAEDLFPTLNDRYQFWSP